MSYDHHSHSYSPSINNTTHPPAEHRGNAESSAGSPQSLFAAGRPLPDSRDVSAHTFHDVADNGVSMKRSRTKWEGSLPMVGSSSIDGIDLSRTAGGMNTMGSETWDMAAVGEAEDDDAGKTSAKGNRKRRRSSASGILTLTSCEACRNGKRRCEPSPLLPPDHPDVAKLPCARCRRFALECIRIGIVRRKGPAPVDLSAISDAQSRFDHPSNGPTSQFPSAVESNPGEIDARGKSNPVPVQSYEIFDLPFGQSNGSFNNLHSPGFPSAIDTSPQSLDEVIAGSIINNVIGFFFDYVYPLTPCLHRPTFLSDLTARRDKTDPVFFALTLSVIASALVQVPRSLVNMDKLEVETLVRRCIRVARQKMAYIWEEPVIVQSSFGERLYMQKLQNPAKRTAAVTICYLEGIVHLLLGNNTAHVIATAQANQLALTLRLNEETSYENLDPIEREIRRRIYWLLFQADKSTACLRARPICLRLEDAPNLLLPSEVDDEHITQNGILPQPPGQTSLITGFNIATKFFRILNDALLLQRRKAPPTVESILADLQNVNSLRERVIQTSLEVAMPLRIRHAYDYRNASPAQDWEAKLQARFLDFFHSTGDTTHALNSFLVMQGNILVTEQVVRLVLLQIRETLLQKLALLTQMPLQGVGSLAGLQMSEVAENIACNLLDGLNSLPVESVATNGPSLVQKVRFVAIQLMGSSFAPTPTTARAQNLLMQFLSVLSVIEGMYTLTRDVSAE